MPKIEYHSKYKHNGPLNCNLIQRFIRYNDVIMGKIVKKIFFLINLIATCTYDSLRYMLNRIQLYATDIYLRIKSVV